MRKAIGLTGWLLLIVGLIDLAAGYPDTGPLLLVAIAMVLFGQGIPRATVTGPPPRPMPNRNMDLRRARMQGWA
jgi:uncharacterized protein (DUF58 family)